MRTTVYPTTGLPLNYDKSYARIDPDSGRLYIYNERNRGLRDDFSKEQWQRVEIEVAP